MNLVRTRYLEGKGISVKDYLKFVIDGELPLVDHIYVGTKEISLEELFLRHLNEDAVFFNNAKYEHDDETEWQIDRYELLLEEPK